HGITHKRLPHGNRESLQMAFFSKDSVLLWSLSTYAKNQSKFVALRDHGEFAHLQWIEFSEPSEASTFLQAIATSPDR
ncbi:MAG: toxin, partial [Comamonas sp.]